MRGLGLSICPAPEGAANFDEKSKDGNRRSFDIPLLSCRAGGNISVAFLLLADTLDGRLLYWGQKLVQYLLLHSPHVRPHESDGIRITNANTRTYTTLKLFISQMYSHKSKQTSERLAHHLCLGVNTMVRCRPL